MNRIGEASDGGPAVTTTAAQVPAHRANRKRSLRAANAGQRRSPPQATGAGVPGTPAPAAPPDGLSVRAENVLKELAVELTAEYPPRGRWIPSTSLLRKLSVADLAAARNCGPQTTAEIIRWAKSQGVVIPRPFHAGKSLAAMWRDIIARSATGEFMAAEIAEALERSLRRKNTRIPVAVQNLLLEVLGANGK